jgi:prepilin-type N-terminal cleavage/methylation domain-containing protein
VRPEREAGGFTLVEILVSVVVFTIGMAGVMAMYTTAGQTNRQAQRLSRGFVLAQELMEDLRGQSVQELETEVRATKGVRQAVPLSNAQGQVYLTYRRSFSVTTLAANPNLVMVDAVVTYAEEGNQQDLHTARVQMLRSRPETF